MFFLSGQNKSVPEHTSRLGDHRSDTQTAKGRRQGVMHLKFSYAPWVLIFQSGSHTHKKFKNVLVAISSHHLAGRS